MLQVQKMNPNTRLSQPIVILLNVQAIEISITNVFDPEKHILVEQKAPSIFAVIKNKSRLLKLTNTLENIISINNNSKQANSLKPIIVSYSPKPSHTIRQKLSKISTSLAQNIIYFNLSPNTHSNIRPNRAFLSYNQQEKIHEITYGEGYSQAKTKQELRLAVECVFGVNSLNERVWIIETQKGLKEEEKELKKLGYKYLWTVDNFDTENEGSTSLQSAIKNLMQPSNQSEDKDQQLPQTPNSSSFYLMNLSKSIKPQEFKQVTSKLELTHGSLTQSFSPLKLLTDFLKYPKKSFTPVPKSSIRSHNSKQVCSLIFKNMGDHKLYLNKSSVPKDIGGLYSQELIENHCFMSMLPNIFHSINSGGFYSLPLDKSYFMMKHSLLKQYETKKACALVKPYLEGLVTLDKFADEFLAMISSKKYHFKGLGQILFWSLTSNQSFQIKTLLEQLTLANVNEGQTIQKITQNQGKSNQNEYLTSLTQDLDSFLQSSSKKAVRLLRTDYFQPFSTQQTPQLQTSLEYQDIKIEFTRRHRVMLKDLHHTYLDEMYQLAVILTGEATENDSDKISLGQKFLKGLANHYKWEFDRHQIIDSLVKRTKILKISLQKILKTQTDYQIPTYSSVSYQFISQITNKNPLSLILLLPRDYARFIKPSTPQQTPFYEMLPKNQQSLENRYVIVLLHKTHSFQVHGNSPPVLSLPNWIRSLGQKYRFIEYISMLTHTKQDFILMSKKLKIMATNEKMNGLLVVDHCQLCEEIMDEAKNVRMIFVTRFKKGQHEMQAIYDEDSEGKEEKYLKDSNDQLISLLMDVYEKGIQGKQQIIEGKQVKQFEKSKMRSGYLYKKYKFVLSTYIKIKSELYNFSPQSVLNFAQSLHKNISQSKNRHKEILQRYKQNNQWKYIYALPLEKNNQKMTFTKNLQGFIDVMKFVELIKGQKAKQQESMREAKRVTSHLDMVKIDQKSLQYISQWAPYIEEDIKQQIIEVLEFYIKPLQHYPLNEYLRTQKLNDQFMLITQVMKIILKDNPQQLHQLFPNQECLCHYPDQVMIKVQQLPMVKLSGLNHQEREDENYYMVHTSHKVVVYSDKKGEKVMELQGKYKDAKGWVEITHYKDSKEEVKAIRLIAQDEKYKQFMSHQLTTNKQRKNLQTSNRYYQLDLKIKPLNQLELTITNIISNYKTQQTPNPQINKTLKFKQQHFSNNKFLAAQIISINLDKMQKSNQKQQGKGNQVVEGFMGLLIVTRREVFLSKIDIKVTCNDISATNIDDLSCYKVMDLEKTQFVQSFSQNDHKLMKHASFVSIHEHNQSLFKSNKNQKSLQSLSDHLPSINSLIVVIERQNYQNKPSLNARIIKSAASLSRLTQSPLIFSNCQKDSSYINFGLLMHHDSIEKQSSTHLKQNAIKKTSMLLIDVDLKLIEKESIPQEHNNCTYTKYKLIQIMNLIEQKASPNANTNVYLHSIHSHQSDPILTNKGKELVVHYTLVDISQPLEKAFSTNISCINSLTIQLNKNSFSLTKFKTHFLTQLPSIGSTYFLPLLPSISSIVTLTDTRFEERKRPLQSMNITQGREASQNSQELKQQYHESFVRLWNIK